MLIHFRFFWDLLCIIFFLLFPDFVFCGVAVTCEFGWWWLVTYVTSKILKTQFLPPCLPPTLSSSLFPHFFSSHCLHVFQFTVNYLDFSFVIVLKFAFQLFEQRISPFSFLSIVIFHLVFKKMNILYFGLKKLLF